MKRYGHRKRDRRGQFVSNPGFFASPLTYVIGLPVLAAAGYVLYRTNGFGLWKPKAKQALPVPTPVPTPVTTPYSRSAYGAA